MFPFALGFLAPRDVAVLLVVCGVPVFVCLLIVTIVLLVRRSNRHSLDDPDDEP